MPQPISDGQKEALHDASDILRFEANSLAYLVDDKAFKNFPPRVDLAVHNEITRLREIAHVLRTIAPSDNDEA